MTMITFFVQNYLRELPHDFAMFYISPVRFKS